MVALFDRVADSYDAVGVDFFQPVAAGLVEALRPQPGERALDLGCGRGAALVPLAEAVTAAGVVVGLDASPRMVELATSAVGAGLPWVEVRVGDATEPDVELSSFDVVASSLVLFLLPEPCAALRAWRRPLVEGGRIGVSTFGPYDDQWRAHVDGAFAALRPPDAPDERDDAPPDPFASDAGVEQLLTDAGFSAVRTVTAMVSPRFDDARHWQRWSMSHGQRWFWDAVPEAERGDVEAVLFPAVEQCRAPDGRLGFDQQIRYTLGTC